MLRAANRLLPSSRCWTRAKLSAVTMAGTAICRLSRRHAPLSQLRSRVDPLSMLAAVSAAMNRHAINILPDMSLVAGDTPRPFQPPVAQRDLEAEVIYCVGGALSPLLANIALSALDDHFDRQWRQEMGTSGQRQKRKRHGQGNWKLIRYADNLVLMVSGDRRHAGELRQEVAAVLAPPGLRLAPEKTRVVHIDEGFDFLGRSIRRMRKRGTDKHYVYTKPSRKAIQAIKDKVKAKTYRSTLHKGLDELITSLNRSLAGMGELLPVRRLQGHVQRGRQLYLGPADALDTRQVRGETPARDDSTPPSLLRPRVEVRLLRGRLHRRIQRRRETLRYRYRGSNIPTPWTPEPAAATSG